MPNFRLNYILPNYPIAHGTNQNFLINEKIKQTIYTKNHNFIGTKKKKIQSWIVRNNFSSFRSNQRNPDANVEKFTCFSMLRSSSWSLALLLSREANIADGFTVPFCPKTEHCVIGLITLKNIQFNQRVTEIKGYYLPVPCSRANYLMNVKSEEEKKTINPQFVSFRVHSLSMDLTSS